MELAAIFLASILSLGALAYAVWPLLKPGPAPIMVEDDALAELINRKDTTLKAIRDLEFDYQVGKIGREDYERYDQSMRRQAMNLLRQIEELAPQAGGRDEQMEKLIRRYRRVGDRAAATGKNGAARTPAARHCSECGAELAAANKFCGNCGTPVPVAESR